MSNNRNEHNNAERFAAGCRVVWTTLRWHPCVLAVAVVAGLVLAAAGLAGLVGAGICVVAAAGVFWWCRPAGFRRVVVGGCGRGGAGSGCTGAGGAKRCGCWAWRCVSLVTRSYLDWAG
jgi:hypothetical protein